MSNAARPREHFGWLLSPLDAAEGLIWSETHGGGQISVRLFGVHPDLVRVVTGLGAPAAAAHSLLKAVKKISLDGLVEIGVGFVTALVVALITVTAVLAVISRIDFTPFGRSRFVIGVVMLAVRCLK